LNGAKSMKKSAVASAANEPVLLKQYKLLGAVIDAPWATSLDHKITRHVIDRYFAKFGNARASLRYLETATGAKRNKIIPSLRRIIGNGAISVIRQGIGTRPTEYDLNFDFVTKPPRGALEGTSASGTLEGTSSGSPDGTSTASSGALGGTESYLRNMSTDMLTVSRIDGTPAVPTAPPVSGLEADTAATAVDPKAKSNLFEDLWAVFPRKHHRSKAQAAYKALAPDAELHANLVASAIAWAAHYEKTGTDRRWWKHLHTWLIEERYLEDVPEPYENPKEAAIARARENRPRNAATKTPSKATGLSPKTPIGRHKVKIVGSDMPDDRNNPEQRLVFSYRIEDGEHDGKEFSHTFHYLSNDDNLRAVGQSIFSDLRSAAGKIDISDTSDLHDCGLLAIVTSMGRVQYEAL
jgi:hypothetical protein